MYKVKIHGAGSIGNHLAHASRTLGWEVHVADVDTAALDRMCRDIYPKRYGAWDESIRLYHSSEVPKGGYDLICVGTPPAAHNELALEALREKPRAVQIEKPLCPPDLAGAQELWDLARDSGTHVFVGYDHVVGHSMLKLEQALVGLLERVLTLDVEFREHWGGIFAAHPWLNGPADSYLGFTSRGGGASGEHSHALNLWQHLAHYVGAGRVVEVSAVLDWVTQGGAEYDRLCALTLRTESGLVGRCVQDVVTAPPRKWARLQGSGGWAELHISAEPGADKVAFQKAGHGRAEAMFLKTRPDDFIAELKHIADVVEGRVGPSPLRLERGLETMLALAAAHRSAREGRVVRIDYAKGYRPEAVA